jgi:carbonic anhydrase/acetyltransferase-like protein (isoleucine patch superfamily)
VHPDAVIIGNVTLGPESSVWPGAVLRGDGAAITIGARSSIQDGSVLHVTPVHPTTVGAECVIGHLVHLEGCTIEDGSLVGSRRVVLQRPSYGARHWSAPAPWSPAGSRCRRGRWRWASRPRSVPAWSTPSA